MKDILTRLKVPQHLQSRYKLQYQGRILARNACTLHGLLRSYEVLKLVCAELSGASSGGCIHDSQDNFKAASTQSSPESVDSEMEAAHKLAREKFGEPDHAGLSHPWADTYTFAS